MINIATALSEAEWELIECKESWSDECLKALAALANTRGGTLLVGVSDDRNRFPGWHGDGRDQERIGNQITSNLHVHPACISVETHNSAPILTIRMGRAAAPVSLRGRYYRRVGNSTREVPAEELPRFLLERTGQSWDSVPGEFSVDDLDAESLDDFKSLARERLPAISPGDTVEGLIKNLRLANHEGRLLRAAPLLFGRDPQRFAPSAQVQIGRFRDDATILDDKRIEGSLFQQLEQVVQVLRGYLLVRYEVPTEMGSRTGVDAVRRQEVWEYPFSALREAVINALVHRDYTSTGRIQIRLYPDRLVITNPGGLPFGLTVSDLLREPHPSLPRNPILAQVFYYSNLVEQWGTGTIRMLRACAAQGLPAPEFASSEGEFNLTLHKGVLTSSQLRQMGLSERQVKAVLYIRDHGSISNSEHQTLTGTTARTAGRDLKVLEELGLLKRSAPTGRTVRYTLVAPSGSSAPP